MRQVLDRLPRGDVEGLAAVKLTPCTQRNNDAYGIYYNRKNPCIELPAIRENPSVTFSRTTTCAWIRWACGVEIRYGMRVVKRGGRWRGDWTIEDLQKYLAEHVLPHEVGHHVQYSQFRAEGKPMPGWAAREDFAESYALRASGVRIPVPSRVHSLFRCVERRVDDRFRRMPQQGHRLYPAQRNVRL